MNYLTIKELSKKYGMSVNIIHQKTIEGRLPFSKRTTSGKKVNQYEFEKVIDEEIFRIWLLIYNYTNKKDLKIFEELKFIGDL